METKYVLAIVIVALAGVLYALVNVCPNKFKNAEPLIKSPIIALIGLLGIILSGAAVITMSCIDVLYGITTLAAFVCGYVSSWYIIKKPERRYIKKHLK